MTMNTVIGHAGGQQRGGDGQVFALSSHSRICRVKHVRIQQMLWLGLCGDGQNSQHIIINTNKHAFTQASTY